MKATKKINNNVVLGRDNNDQEVIIVGKGLGFEKMPYELTDLSKIDRTYYGIDSKYYGLLKEIPERTFLIVSKLLDVAKTKIRGDLNPNLVFILADHINFAVERYNKNMNISLPYSYEMEYTYPEITKISRWFVKVINEKFHVHLEKGEVTSISMHLVNALEGVQKDSPSIEEKATIVIAKVTLIIESFFDIKIDKSNFDYYRFQNHIKYFVQRKINHEEFTDANVDLFQHLKDDYPKTYECVILIDDYLFRVFRERCSTEELLYLIVHVNRLYQRGL